MVIKINRMKYLLLLFFTTNIMAQETQNNDKLPYYEVPEYYSEYTTGTVVARMVDGLGFRYRWATENLRPEDLKYKISEDGRTSEETINHILGLSRVIVNSTLKVPTDYTVNRASLTYEQKRKETLENFYKASQILQKAKSLKAFKIKFISARGESEYPFWNQINGPIADAIWHCGQIVSMRRASGNPLNSKVSFLQGKVRE